MLLCTPLHTQFHLEGYSDKKEYTIDGNVITENKYGDGSILKDYVDAVKKVASIFSVPVVDLYEESGLCPIIEANNSYYFVDGLHPNERGGEVIAKIIDKKLKDALKAIW